MSTFRNPDLLERLGRHPMKGALAKCLDVAETFIGDCERVRIDRHLSDSGRVAAVEKHLRSALRDIRDARTPVIEMKATVEAKRAAVKQPTFPADDVVGFLRRQEMRAAVRALPVAERMASLTGTGANNDIIDAVLEQPPMLTGFTDPNLKTIYERAQQERLKSLFGPPLAEIEQLETTIAEADMIVDLAGIDMQTHSGLQPEKYAQLRQAIEAKTNAPWLKKYIEDGKEVIRVIDIEKHYARTANIEDIKNGKYYADHAEYQADRAA